MEFRGLRLGKPMLTRWQLYPYAHTLYCTKYHKIPVNGYPKAKGLKAIPTGTSRLWDRVAAIPRLSSKLPPSLARQLCHWTKSSSFLGPPRGERLRPKPFLGPPWGERVAMPLKN